MKPSTLFKSYIWLYNTIRNYGPLTMKEINEMWMAESMSNGEAFSRMSFIRHRNDVEELFGVDIACDKQYRYYINNRKLSHADSVAELLMATLTEDFSLLNRKSIYSRVLLEPNPSAGLYLNTIVDSMEKCKVIEAEYQRYENTNIKSHRVEPYCVKQYHQRWYILGRKSDGYFITLALDRIKKLQVTKEKFKMDDDFDAIKYYEDSFGLIVDESIPAERIVIRAMDTEPNYLRDLKLHPSQKEIAVGDGYSDFELTLRPTNDFIGKLMERGDRIVVLHPRHLAEELEQRHGDCVKLYKQMKDSR